MIKGHLVRKLFIISYGLESILKEAPCRKSSRNLNAETEIKTIEECCFLLSFLTYTAQAHLPKVTTHSGLGPPTITSN